MLANTDSSQPASEVRLSIEASARGETEPRAPGIGDDPFTARRLDLVARGGESIRRRLRRVRRREDHAPLEQPRIALSAGRRVRSGPRIHAEVVMVATGREEERSRI